MDISKRFPSSRLDSFDSCQSEYICVDLLILILSWFPVKTLLICRSVCKSWKQIIDSATFVLDHLSNQRPRLLLQNHSFQYHLLDPDYYPIFDTISPPDGIDLGSEPSHLLAIGTIHGVVCLYDNGDNLFLWNPSIRRLRRIPLHPSESVWNNFCGFWMDSETKEFKVVIFYIAADAEKGGSVFSSKDQKWREFVEEEMAVFSDNYQTNNQSPQFLSKGVAYWIATDYQDYFGGLIVYYDFKQDKFGKIVLPDDVRGCSVGIEFSLKSYGSLSILATSLYPGYSTAYEIWDLESGSWRKMGYVSPLEGIRGVFCVLDTFNALASNSDGELVVFGELENLIHPVFTKNDYHNRLNLKQGDKYLFSYCFDFVESLIFPY